jgi:uncharacterized protein (TIGR02246 family)
MTVAEWIQAYGRAWRDRDADAAAGPFTPDAVYRSHPLREPHVGTDAIREHWRGVTTAQEELDLRFGMPIVENDRAAVEWW